jgi:dynamin GTPase
MVVALVDMERAFVPPQHFIRLVQRRMERQRREEELKGRSSKKGQDAEQSLLSRATSPQPDGPTAGGSLKSMKDKPSPQDKETPEVSGLKTAGPEGEITAGCYSNIHLPSYCLKSFILLFHSRFAFLTLHDFIAAKLCS